MKTEFSQTGSGYPGAIYFKTISADGPQLFAVVDDKLVFYHENDCWHRYLTATYIKFGILLSNNSNVTHSEVNRNCFYDKEWIFISRDKEFDFDQH